MSQDQRDERILESVTQLKRWMSAHQAGLLVQNLAPGATPEMLDDCAKRLGVPLPPDLRALWSVHAGQLDEQNGFVENQDLLGPDRTPSGDVTIWLEYLREDEDCWEEAGVREDEVRSNAWFHLAERGYDDLLVVSGVTGRVFTCGKASPPFRFVAESVLDWIESYAADVLAGEFTVEEGFGDYHLQRRNRQAEREDRERAERAAERERFRRETPLVDQFRQALDKKDEDRCMEVLEDALARKDTQAFETSVEMLFSAGPGPELTAAALRPMLSSLELTPDRWVDVAMGGALLGNTAIRDQALPHCKGASPERITQLASAVSAAAEPRRKALADVLQKLGGKEPGGSGSWLSRWFSPKR